MSASPTEVDVDEVEDISVLRDYYRELQQRNQHLQSLVAEDRQRLQKIEFDHRESVDQIALLKSQKQAIQQQLEQSAIKNRILEDKDSIDDALDDVSSASDENDNSNNNNNNNDDNNNNNNNDTKKSKKKNEIEQLKEEIEDLQLALAEERMLGMQLDFTNRQSSQRADALQYQLAEEKLKNMHLQSSHQQLQLGDSNSSGFVHLRDSNNNDKEIINNNNHNNENNKKKRKNRNKTNDNDDESVASDLSKEFDLKIEEERVPEVSPDEEAKELRHKLLEEQFEKEELKHQHRKSELQLMQYKEELADLRKKHEQNYTHLDPESALNHLNNNNNENSQKTTATSLTDQERQMYEAKIKELSDQLDISKKKTMSLDRQRRDSLNIMSKNFFAKQLQAARDTHSIEENLQLEIEQLKGDLYDLTKSKVNLLQNTNDTIDQLRQHIVELSNRLRKYEKWDTNGTNNNKNSNSNSNTNENENDDNDSGYDVTDL